MRVSERHFDGVVGQLNQRLRVAARPLPRAVLTHIIRLYEWNNVGRQAMDMIRVSSAAITAVGYDPATMRMRIRFVQGETYDFCRVPTQVFQGLLDARSKGSYYNDHIRDRYQC